jgi:protein-tyrosine phosphatase
MVTDEPAASDPHEATAPYRILFVCTGNICRSPFMERLMRARLDAKLGTSAGRIQLASAGTWAMVGEPMAEAAATSLVRYGGDPSGFVARSLDAEEINAADLVLTATRDHRSMVVTTVPRAAGKVATLREFARLLSGVTIAKIVPAGADPANQFRAIAAAAFAQRGVVPAVDPVEDDIPDPYGGPDAGYQLAAELIDEALRVPLFLVAA